MNKILTISIAAYNVENFIKKALDSLLGVNNAKDIEILVEDDGGTDNTANIVIEYEEKYPDIVKLIHKENGGLSDARNVGIENATGEYIQFIDSDDFVEKDMIEILHNDICQEKADVSMCSLYLYKDGEKTKIRETKNYKDSLFVVQLSEIIKCANYMKVSLSRSYLIFIIIFIKNCKKDFN